MRTYFRTSLMLLTLTAYGSCIAAPTKEKSFGSRNKVKIIFLNGSSSAGKSSIAKTLQEMFHEPYLHLSIDTFWGMLPKRYFGQHPPADQGFYLIRSTDASNNPITRIKKGAIGKKVCAGMLHAIAAFAQQGNNLIIDDILLSQDDLRKYVQLLKNFTVLFVGVHAPLEIIEQRERERGNRILGLARGMVDIVHANKIYDLEIDTSELKPQESAQKIKEFLTNNPNPQAFKKNVRSS